MTKTSFKTVFAGRELVLVETGQVAQSRQMAAPLFDNGEITVLTAATMSKDGYC